MQSLHPSKNPRPFLHRPLFAVLLLAATALPGSAHAAVETYSDLASFQAASGMLTTITFTGDAPDGSFTTQGTSFIESGVTFQTGAENALNTTSDTYSTGYNYGTGVVLNTVGNAPRILNIVLPAGTTAFGINFGAFIVLSNTFTLSTGESFTRDGGTPTGSGGSGLAFIGFTSSAALSSVQVEVEESGEGNAVDNVAFGTANVPEPSTWTFVVAGVGLLGVAAQRRASGTSSSQVV